MLSGYGVPVDAVVGDFMSGEIEHAIDHVGNGADLVIVEGQGSLTNMYYSGVTLALMHGAMPDFMIMTDEPGRKKDVTGYPMSTIREVMQLHLDLMKNFKQSQFLGINLLTLNMEENEALHEIKKLEKEHKMPVTDLIRFGDGDLINNIVQSFN